jgi:hypothetical protein
MLPVYTHASRGFLESESRSALPGAPVLPVPESAPATGPRRAVAGALLRLADRVSPEPVQRSRWQNG